MIVRFFFSQRGALHGYSLSFCLPSMLPSCRVAYAPRQISHLSEVNLRALPNVPVFVCICMMVRLVLILAVGAQSLRSVLDTT